MKALSLFMVLLVSLRVARALRIHRVRVPIANVGEPCTPSVPTTCGQRELLAETSEQPTGTFGPNVCNFTKTFQIGTNTHSFQRRCSHWFGRCRLYCLSDNICTGPMVNFTKHHIDCCDGFTTAQSDSRIPTWAQYHRYHHHHHRQLRSFIIRNAGCTVALMPTVVDCLDELNATTFRSLITSAPDLLQTLNSEDSRVTVFAPTNEAIEGLNSTMLEELFGGGSAVGTLSAHVASRIVPNAKLVHGGVLRTLAENRFLHVTEVDNFQRRRYFHYNAGERTFINGAEVVVKDACQARNGIVHVVDSIVPSSNLTIAEQLGEDSQFSTFKDLLDTSGVSAYLNNGCKSRTVFAPTNDAFNQLRDGAVECLKMENNSRLLRSLVLLHISYPAEYTSSLCLRNHLATFLGPILKVQCINDTVHITRDEIPLEEGADRPARNGVFHAIDEVIVPDCIDFESMCPDVPDAPTTPPTVDVPFIPPESTNEPSVIPTLPGPGNIQEGIPVDEAGTGR